MSSTLHDAALVGDVPLLKQLLDGGAEVDTIHKDTVFGEVALVYDLPRTATIKATTKCQMWMLHRAMFQHILRDKAISERKAKFSFLKTVKIFASLSGRQISRIADVVEMAIFEAEDVIIGDAHARPGRHDARHARAVERAPATRLRSIKFQRVLPRAPSGARGAACG